MWKLGCAQLLFLDSRTAAKGCKQHPCLINNHTTAKAAMEYKIPQSLLFVRTAFKLLFLLSSVKKIYQCLGGCRSTDVKLFCCTSPYASVEPITPRFSLFSLK